MNLKSMLNKRTAIRIIAILVFLFSIPLIGFVFFAVLLANINTTSILFLVAALSLMVWAILTFIYPKNVITIFIPIFLLIGAQHFETSNRSDEMTELCPTMKADLDCIEHADGFHCKWDSPYSEGSYEIPNCHRDEALAKKALEHQKKRRLENFEYTIKR